MKKEVRRWSLAQMPDLAGCTAIVTGPTSGIGAATARELAGAGARVVLAGRNEERLDAVANRICAAVPGAALDALVLDLTSLDSVRAAGAAAASYGPIDLLINNAGVMATPRRRTVDGLDLQMATNHFGPFLFTGLLWPQLAAAPEARVVTVSSLAHRTARRAPLNDPHVEPGRYSRWGTYAESKLANLLLTYGLAARASAARTNVRALAAHPGLAATHLLSNGQTGRGSGGIASILNGAMALVAQSSDDGALPSLMAACDDLRSGTFCGPGGPGETRGAPRPVGSSSLARDTSAQDALWELSERTVGLVWPQAS